MNGQPGTVYPDSSFDVPGVPVVPGTNILVATYVGPAYTNVPMTATDTSTIVLGDTTYTHDANGNLTSDATFTYQYDLANQLTNVIRKADNTVVLQCRYDALGRRVEAIRSDGTTDRYVYFPGSFLVLAVLDETNTAKELYTRGPDLSGTLDSAGGISGILACTYSSAPTAPLYYHADLMGNVVALTDPSSLLKSSFSYTPFGQIVSHMDTCIPRYLWNSKEQLASGLLYDYGFRIYAVSEGRWLTRDPIGPYGGINLYSYVGNSPANIVDHWGLHGSRYDYTIFLGIGAPDGNDLIEKAAEVALEFKQKYVPPTNAFRRCLFVILANVRSDELRTAAKQYDEIHFFGHGNKDGERNQTWEKGDPADQLYTYHTSLTFSDKKHYLKDVLDFPAAQAKAKCMTPWVCHDRYVDATNNAGIFVQKPRDNPDPNQTAELLLAMVTQIETHLKEQLCCAPLD